MLKWLVEVKEDGAWIIWGHYPTLRLAYRVMENLLWDGTMARVRRDDDV